MFHALFPRGRTAPVHNTCSFLFLNSVVFFPSSLSSFFQ